MVVLVGLGAAFGAPLIPYLRYGRLTLKAEWRRLSRPRSLSKYTVKGPGEKVPDLENGRILELLLSRWALEGSEANLTQLVVPVM